MGKLNLGNVSDFVFFVLALENSVRTDDVWTVKTISYTNKESITLIR